MKGVPHVLQMRHHRAPRAVSGWMTSPGHRANILSPDYRSSGIGVAVNGAYAYATQVFRGAPKSAATRLTRLASRFRLSNFPTPI